MSKKDFFGPEGDRDTSPVPLRAALKENGMFIRYHESGRMFHLQNEKISYIMQVLPTGALGQLYYGKKIHDREGIALTVLIRRTEARIFLRNM